MHTVLWARSEESAARAGGRLDGAADIVTDLDGLGDRSLVIEAVAEDAQLKADLLGGLGVLLPGDALVATTTSSLSIEGLAGASGRADRFAGLHVFNPVEKMALVELAFPAAASEGTRAQMTALCEALGKTAVEVPDVPGFVVNRLLFPFAFEAVRLMDSMDMEPAAVDTCMRLGAGHPIGPLALLDLVGLDVSAAIGESIGAEVPQRLHDLVAAGRLGRKTGAGFYEYS
ncbi:hypothetical protein BH20ACT19_BH20ACT19_08630 [soil metagenome]